MIPMFFVSDLVFEREKTWKEAVREVGSKWGLEQVITGPILSIPYLTKSIGDDKKITTVRNYIHILPDKLSIQSNIVNELKYRGIYKVSLYQSNNQIASTFSLPDFKTILRENDELLLLDATIILGISDLTGLKDQVNISWNNKMITAEPGLPHYLLINSGVQIPVELTSTHLIYEFSTELNLNGTSSIQFAPIGKETIVSMQSDWPDPSFSGNFLPFDKNISVNGFDAKWKVLHLNRNYPQIIRNTIEESSISNSTFGVNLYIPLDHYKKTTRTTKYSLMFIGLTFITFFMIEILNKSKLHLIQYSLIAFSLIIFYTLLLSISEHIGFNFGYWISAVLIIGVISLYSKAIIKSTKLAGYVLGVMILLYGYLFIVLQMEDFALLFGSILLFIILSLIMYLTKDIDWFGIADKKETESKPK